MDIIALKLNFQDGTNKTFNEVTYLKVDMGNSTVAFHDGEHDEDQKFTNVSTFEQIDPADTSSGAGGAVTP